MYDVSYCDGKNKLKGQNFNWKFEKRKKMEFEKIVKWISI